MAASSRKSWYAKASKSPLAKLLLKIDPTRFVSSLKENRVEYLGLLAKAARLQALADTKAFVTPPDVAKEAPELAEQERQMYESKKAEMFASAGVSQQQYSQRSLKN